MPLMGCLDCKRLTRNGSRCEPCQQARTRARDRARPARPSATQRGYNAEYQKNRKILLSEKKFCEICRERIADSVDHIVPLSFGGTNNLSNLRPTCLTCNKKLGNRGQG